MRVAAARIAELARELLDASTLCAIATVSPDGKAYVNTAYIAWGPELDVVWISDPGARHSRNVRANGSVAIAAYDSTQTWGMSDRGIQLFGSAHEGDGEAKAIYARRFPEYVADDFASYRPYRFRPRRIKLFDERALGPAVFVSARVGARGRVVWERTERY
jgi:uncharacterized protein YhbP (UPF0306 family)